STGYFGALKLAEILSFQGAKCVFAVFFMWEVLVTKKSFVAHHNCKQPKHDSLHQELYLLTTWLLLPKSFIVI
ncbi:hypothetical protein, partial [Phascolarctobacterium sp.]|uniref:hypothetical protein n=1 Tax=Phascolarctobacterium sp. TaxID=2049039 RepID=UPI003862EB9D